MNRPTLSFVSPTVSAQQPAAGVTSNIIPKDSVVLAGTRLKIRAPGSTVRDEPQMELIQSGQEIRGVEIHCCCGQTIRLEFEY